VFANPRLECEIGGGVEGDEIRFAMASIRGDREVSLGRNFFHSRERYDLLVNRWIDLRGVRFPGKKGGSQVVGNSLWQDKEVGSQTVEGGLESAADGIPDDQRKEDRSGADGECDGEKEISAGSASGLLEDQTESDGKKVKSLGQGV